jgi:transcriptional regulator GlxA family with amidase domain
MKANTAADIPPLDVQLLWLPEALSGTLFSALDVLRIASAILNLRNPGKPCPLTWRVITPDGLAVNFDASPPGTWSSAPPLQVEASRSLIIVPGMFTYNLVDLIAICERHPAALHLLQSHAGQGGLIATSFNGLIFPARLGMLDGLKTGTHWAIKAFFVMAFPACDFSSDAPMIFHERIFTCVAPGQQTEFIIEILGRLYDADLSVACAQMLQFQPLRQQMSNGLYEQEWLTRTSDSPVFRAKQWLEANLEQPYRLPELAAVASASERTLLRHFKAAIGMTPLEYLQNLRIERAKIMLEVSLNNLHTVAAACGYTDSGSFRRLFHRATGMSPGEYRKRFTYRAKRVHWRVESALDQK